MNSGYSVTVIIILITIFFFIGSFIIYIGFKFYIKNKKESKRLSLLK
jgi:hypothetical protein